MSEIIAIPALSDNYIWSWQLDDKSWVVVDPGDARPVITAIGKEKLSYILITHHHHDHTGGVSELKARYPSVKILGPKDSCIDLTHILTDGDIVLGLQVIATPGHTLDHIIYVDQQKVFLGDHLFKYGCGRIFETDMPTMYDSLNKLKHVAKGRIGYSAHEYTLTNLEFVARYWPWDGYEIALSKAKTQTNTLPLDMDEQCLHNPFLACKDLSEFIELRLAKNNFRI